MACHDSSCSTVNEYQLYRLLSPLLLQITDYMKLQYKNMVNIEMKPPLAILFGQFCKLDIVLQEILVLYSRNLSTF